MENTIMKLNFRAGSEGMPFMRLLEAYFGFTLAYVQVELPSPQLLSLSELKEIGPSLSG